SADVTPEAIQSCEQAGAYAFIAKPVVASKLLDTLAAIAGGEDPEVAAGGREPRLPLDDSAFDPQVLEELGALGMGKAFERKFVNQCLDDAAGALARFEQFGAGGQWDQLRDQAHALKGVAG